MPKRVSNKERTLKFKKLVVETMPEEYLGHLKTAERFGVRHKCERNLEEICLLEGPNVSSIERRGLSYTGRPRKLPKSVRTNTKCCTTRGHPNYTDPVLPNLSNNLPFAKFDFNGEDSV